MNLSHSLLSLNPALNTLTQQSPVPKYSAVMANLLPSKAVRLTLEQLFRRTQHPDTHFICISLLLNSVKPRGQLELSLQFPGRLNSKALDAVPANS